MAKKVSKKRSTTRRSKRGKSKRKSSYIKAGRKGHVKRGCGKRNWRRGGNARWKCKTGKKFPYKTHSKGKKKK